MDRLNVILSNRSERLYQHFRERAFGEEVDPFVRRLVIVPSSALKAWLQRQLADDRGVAAGMQVVDLEGGLKELLGKSTLSLQELSLACEAVIRQKIHEPLWQPLARYLRVPLSKRGDRRLTALSNELAHLFTRYNTYGELMVREWEKRAPQGWQEELWQTLFCGTYKPLYRELETVLPPVNTQVHLFSVSFLPRIELTFFEKLARHIPVHLYLLSPCQTFWSDLRRDGHPLLGSMGKLGREMARLLEESHAVTVEDYALPEEALEIYEEHLLPDLSLEARPFSLLDAVQGDMVLLCESKKSSSDAIQLHVATSRLREVQIAYDKVLELIEKGSFYPQEIVLMAPDINLYAPYIEAVFGAPDSLLDFQVMDAKVATESTLVQGFLHLLTLAKSRFDLSSIMQLFDYPEFQKRAKLSLEEVKELREWAGAANVLWGCDADHRNELIGRKMVDSSSFGTWKHAFATLLRGLAENTELELSQAELLGRWIALLTSIREDLKPLQDGTLLTLSDWTRYLRCLFDAYFQGEEIFSDFKIDLLEETLFPFTTIRHHLEAALCRRTTSHREHHLHSVRFTSLLPMRSVPAKVIWLMGMDEEAFPKIERRSSLDLLQKAEYCPTTSDYDRYIFLEAILSARNHFIMSYVTDTPSILVTELLSYVKTVTAERHSFHAFASKSYSKPQYRAALANEKVLPPHRFFPEFFIGGEVASSGNSLPKTIDIKEFVALSRNPIKAYCNRKLGLYLEEKEDVTRRNEENFTLSSLDYAILKRESLRGEPLTEERFPLGTFGAVARERIAADVAKLKGLSFFQIELRADCQEASASPQGWILPPVMIHDRKIVGKIPDVTTQGLFIHGKLDPSTVAKAWPYLLMLSHLPEEVVPKQILFETGSPKQVSLDDNAWEAYLDHYLHSSHHFSPLLPEWVEELYEGDHTAFETKVKKSLQDPFSPFYNRYAEWALTTQEPLSRDFFETWHKRTRQLFGAGYEALLST